MASRRSNLQPIRLFYSYSHEDEDLRKELEKHLAVLRRRGIIESFPPVQVFLWLGREFKLKLSVLKPLGIFVVLF